MQTIRAREVVPEAFPAWLADVCKGMRILLAQAGVIVEIPFKEAASPGEAAAPGPAEVVGIIVDVAAPVAAEDSKDKFASAPEAPSLD